MIPVGAWARPIITKTAHMCLEEMQADDGVSKRWVWKSMCGKVFNSKYTKMAVTGKDGDKRCGACARMAKRRKV